MWKTAAIVENFTFFHRLCDVECGKFSNKSYYALFLPCFSTFRLRNFCDESASIAFFTLFSRLFRIARAARCSAVGHPCGLSLYPLSVFTEDSV